MVVGLDDHCRSVSTELCYSILFYSILVKQIGMCFVNLLCIYVVILPDNQREASG